MYTSSNGAMELDIVSRVISQSNDGDPPFQGTWMLVAQWTEVASFGGNSNLVNYWVFV